MREAGHALRTRDDADRMGNIGRVLGLERFGEEGRYCFGRVEVFSWIVGDKRVAHFTHSIVQPSFGPPLYRVLGSIYLRLEAG